MKTNNKTLLITGGGSGIGFHIARLFSEAGSKVIITGRNEDRLKSAAAKLSNVDYWVTDITKTEDIDNLVAHIKTNYPTLDILINNAGNASAQQVGNENIDLAKVNEEIVTNYLAPVNLTEKLLPLLEEQTEAAVVNVTSIVALAPAITIPTYSASKAALRAYTQILRLVLAKKRSTVKVFELMPPLLNTDFSKEIGGENGIPPEQVAQDLFKAFETEAYEVHVGATEQIYNNFFGGSEKAVEAINQTR